LPKVLSLTLFSDPIWFLHHSQLDRLWWKWQQADPLQRLFEYNGKANNNTDEAASLLDVLDYGSFVAGVRVEQVMDTASDLLCYRYA